MQGYTDRENPTKGVHGVHGFPEPGRDHYVDDRVYSAIWQVACQPLRDAMDLAYLTGQRPSDVLRLSRGDIRDGALWLRHAKIRTRLRIAIEGELARVLKRVTARRHSVECLQLVRNEAGQLVTYPTLRTRFDKARVAAAEGAKKKRDRDLERHIRATQF